MLQTIIKNTINPASFITSFYVEEMLNTTEWTDHVLNPMAIDNLMDLLYPGTTLPILKIHLLLIHTKFRHKTFHL